MQLTEDQINEAARNLSLLVAENVPQRETTAKAYFTALKSIGVEDESIKAISDGAAKLIHAYVELIEAGKKK